MVAAHLVAVLADRHHVDALAGLQRQRPVVLGHAGHYVVVRQRPVGTDVTVFYPDVIVLLCKLKAYLCVLHEDAGVRLTVVVHDVALVVDDILNSQRRGNHLARGSEMVELATRQRHDGYRQRLQLRVVDGRLSAQGAAEIGVQVIFADASPPSIHRPPHEQLHGTVAEQPDADVRQVEMVLLQFGQPLDAGLLQHLLQHAGRPAVADEDTMILGNGGVEPQAIAHHVGLGNLSYALGSTDIDVAADNHRCQTLRSLFHQSFVERQLQVEERLRQLLSTLPAEYGNRCQHLAADGIGRQALAASAGMQDDAFLLRQPVVKVCFTFPCSLFTCIRLLQQPGGSTTRP